MKRLFSFALLLIALFISHVIAAQEVPVLIQPAQAGQQARPGQPGQPQAQPAGPPATLSGHVYSMDTGQPLRRAQVTLRSIRSSLNPMSAATDAQGAFQFTGVEPGPYTLQCTRTGYMAAYYVQKGADSGSLTTSMLTVRPGEEVKNLDFTLVRGGVIAGVVTDEDGEPIPRAQVAVVVRTWTRGRAQFSQRNSGSTDDRGNYRVFGLTPGRYYVRASYSGYGPDQVTYGATYFPNVAAPRDAQPIPILNGAEVPNINFQLRPVQTFTLSGRVMDPATGQALVGAQVSMSPDDPQDGGFGTRGGMSRPDGAFTFSGLLPGRYRIQIMRTTTVIRAADGSTTSVVTPGRATASVKFFDMPAGDVKDLVLTADPGATVKGRVILEGASVTELLPPQPAQQPGLQVGQQRAPSRGTVMLRPRDGTSISMGSAQLAQNLTFEIPNVPAGEYDVMTNVAVVGGANAGRPYVRELRLGSQDITDKGLTVAEGSSPQIEVVVAYDSGTVNGRLLDEGDQPMNGLAVLVSADVQKRTLDQYFRMGSSRSDGRFTITGVPPGDYLLLAWPNRESAGRAQDPELVQQIDKLGTRVRVEKNGTVTQDAKLAPEIRKLADQ